jgi:hypothetical protein
MKLNLFAVLGVIFVVLKLTGLIAWSWWWVLAPFVVNLATFLVVLMVLVIGSVAMTFAEKH